MCRIAALMKECLIENKSVRNEVNIFRNEYQSVKYCFDKPEPRQLEVVAGKI